MYLSKDSNPVKVKELTSHVIEREVVDVRATYFEKFIVLKNSFLSKLFRVMNLGLPGQLW